MQQQSFHVYAVHFVDQLFTHSLLRALSHLPLMQMLHFFHMDDLGAEQQLAAELQTKILFPFTDLRLVLRRSTNYPSK